MLLEFIVLSVIGIVFFIIGWLIWGLFCEWIWTYGLCRDEI